MAGCRLHPASERFWASEQRYSTSRRDELLKIGEREWLNALGLVYDRQGRYAKVAPLYRRSLAIAEKVLGPEHPNVATSLNNLASFYYVQRKYAEAEPLYRRALAIFEKALGPEHLDVARSLENYAKLLRTTNRKAEAAKMEARARAIRAKHAKKNPKQ